MSGHYICDSVHPCKDVGESPDRWLTFNDSQVFETSGSRICKERQRSAYILFYKKQVSKRWEQRGRQSATRANVCVCVRVCVQGMQERWTDEPDQDIETWGAEFSFVNVSLLCVRISWSFQGGPWKWKKKKKDYKGHFTQSLSQYSGKVQALIAWMAARVSRKLVEFISNKVFSNRNPQGPSLLIVVPLERPRRKWVIIVTIIMNFVPFKDQNSLHCTHYSFT